MRLGERGTSCLFSFPMGQRMKEIGNRKQREQLSYYFGVLGCMTLISMLLDHLCKPTALSKGDSLERKIHGSLDTIFLL